MESIERIRVFTVDDHPLMHEGLAAIVNSQPDMMVVAQAENAAAAINDFHKHRPDVTLMDLRLPDMSGIDALIAIRTKEPAARIIMLTTFEGDIEVQRALKAGASGYLLKSTPPPALVEAIRRVHRGKRHVAQELAAQLAENLSDDDLTPREIEVLRLIAEGSRNHEIAASLFLSEETVKTHIKHIMLKLDASDRTQAVTIAVRRGIIHL